MVLGALPEEACFCPCSALSAAYRCETRVSSFLSAQNIESREATGNLVHLVHLCRASDLAIAYIWPRFEVDTMSVESLNRVGLISGGGEVGIA